MNVKMIAVAAAALAVGAVIALATLPPVDWSGRQGASQSGGTTTTTNAAGQSGSLGSTGKALVGGPFTLTDQTGKRVTERDFLGRHMLVFFGFTYCPDICPSGLAVISAALDQLGADSAGITPLFVTIDPERDTPAKMAEYVKSFHPRLIGLSGSPAEIASVIKAYRVYAKKVPDDRDPASNSYTMDHSSIAYLMGPDGAFRAVLPDLSKPDKLAAEIRKALLLR